MQAGTGVGAAIERFGLQGGRFRRISGLGSVQDGVLVVAVFIGIFFIFEANPLVKDDFDEFVYLGAVSRRNAVATPVGQLTTETQNLVVDEVPPVALTDYVRRVDEHDHPPVASRQLGQFLEDPLHASVPHRGSENKKGVRVETP